MLLVIDNFDSFTFNLVQYFGQLGVEQRVFRNTVAHAHILSLVPLSVKSSNDYLTNSVTGATVQTSI